ncbi:MAG TPA: peptidoglycan-binding protein, partial [Xanthobacteraceae bacterium]|nr:peptidoglycan-binding protein [Xanthobacteraceae bacterium]
MLRLHLCVIAAVVALASPVVAQFGGAPIMPGDKFRPQAPIQITPRDQAAPVAMPVVAPPKPRLPTAAVSPPGSVRLAIVSSSLEPTYDEGSVERLSAALRSYESIEARGGWLTLPADTAKLEPGADAPEVAALRMRLSITGDLGANQAAGTSYDQAVVAAVKRFQARHGISETGTVGPQTLSALNVPVARRIRQISASLERLAATNFNFGQRYVVVNIPAAVAEAVDGGRVDHRYVAVVGKPDRPSPTVISLITTVNLNPTWTAPLSIV